MMVAETYSALTSAPSSMRPLLSRGDVAFGHNILRDQFTITTWLLFDALLQVSLLALPIPTLYMITPAIGLMI